MADPLFTVLPDGRLQPNGPSRGPWSRDALHGGPVAAVVARAAEAVLAAAGSEAVEPVRLTLDLERPVPLAPLTVAAEIVRGGRRVQVAQVTVHDDDGRLLVTGRVEALRRADLALPDGLLMPEDPPPPGPDEGRSEEPWLPMRDLEVFHAHGVEHRYVDGGFMASGPATDWIRLRVPVVDGEEPSGFQRVAAAADFGNGISSILSWQDWTFINPDLTVTLHRSPVGEWVCLRAVTRLDPSGVGTAECELFDERGRIGHSVQTLLVQPANG